MGAAVRRATRWGPMDYEAFFASAIERLRSEGNYRNFADLDRRVGDFPRATHKTATGTADVTIWCSNDYLGMGQNEVVRRAMKEAIDASGSGTGGTRSISGTGPRHVVLERSLAALHGKPSALLFTSGYVANEAVLSTLGRSLPGCVFVSDALNHASMIAGMRNSRAEKRIFAHNDPEDLSTACSASSVLICPRSSSSSRCFRWRATSLR